MAKELFADYVKEKKLSEPEEKKELAQTFKTYILCRSKKERIRSMYSKRIIRFGFCDIQNNQRHQPRPSAFADNPYLTLIILDITKPHPIIVKKLFLGRTFTRVSFPIF